MARPPWEQYAAKAPAQEGPWTKYQTASTATSAPEDEFNGVEMRDNLVSDKNLQRARSALRTVGRVGADVAEGGLQLVTVPLDLLGMLANYGIRKVHQPDVADVIKEDTAPPQIPSASAAVRRLVRDPVLEPQTAGERVADDVISGVAGSLTGSGLAKQLATRVANPIIQSLSKAPGTQAAAAATGAAASGIAREEGGGTMAQIAAGVAGGVPGSMAVSAGRGAGALARTALAPKGQREVIAGDILRDASRAPNVDDTIKNLEGATDLVPGSKPTAGQVSRDPGIAYLENRLRALDASRFTERASSQNAARNAFLDDIADGGLPEAVKKRFDTRERVTTGLRTNAFNEAQGKAVPTAMVQATIGKLMRDPENAGQSVQQALKSIERQLLDADGNPITDARALYAVRKEINRVLEGRYVGADESVLRYAGSQLKAVRGSIDDAISDIAPSWKRYLTVYSRMSKPIERAEQLQDIRGRTSVAAPDFLSGEDVLSQAKFKQVVTKNMRDLSKVFTSSQLGKLRQVADDLDRGAAAARVEPAGSATAANMLKAGQMTMAHVIGRFAGMRGREMHSSLAAATKPLSWLLNYNDEKIRVLLGEAMLDPALAADLMKKATPEAVESVGEALRLFAQTSSAGGIAGAAAASPEF